MATSNIVEDGFTTQGGGMNDGKDGSLLGAAQFQLMVNGTQRGGFLRQRPGFRRVMQVKAPGGYFQHGGWLRTRNGRNLLVAVVDGRFYRVDPEQKAVSEFTIPGDPNPKNLGQGWSMPGGAEGFWVYQDGQSPALIWNGSSARRATEKEIRPGRNMAYVQGRIWYAMPDTISFRATDLVDGESGTAAYNFKDSILKETENTYLNEGGSFAVPADSGGITAMAATSMLDTSQGQGPLQVFCEKTAFSVNTPVDRTIWKNVTYPIITTSLIAAGALGAQSTIRVNSDIFMRSKDGIRSLILARRVFRDWGNTPQSFEVSGILNYDQLDLLTFSSATVFDNRLLMTVSPSWSEYGVFHRGMVAMDLSPISSILEQGTPVYDGVWSGFSILSIQQTDKGTYFFNLCEDGSIDLWEMTKTEVHDIYDDTVGRIQWSVFPRKFFVERDAAGRPKWNLKKLQTADISYDNLAGSVAFSVFYRPDAYPCWQSWQSWEECAPVCNAALTCTPPAAFQTQYRPRRRLPEPPDICVPGIKNPLRMFFDMDLRIDITGPARFRSVRIKASSDGEPAYEPDCGNPVCIPIKCCDFDPFTYVARGTDGEAAAQYNYSGRWGSGGSVTGPEGTGVLT